MPVFYNKLYEVADQAAAIPGLLALCKENGEYIYPQNDLKVITMRFKPKMNSDYVSALSLRVVACLTSTRDPNIRVASGLAYDEVDALVDLQRILEEAVAKKVTDNQTLAVPRGYEIMDSDSYRNLC